MNIYHIWCDLKPGVQDTDFTDAAKTWLEALSNAGYLAAFRITRRKLGLGGPADFHLMLEFENLDSLDKVFHEVATRSGPVESFHHAVNSKVTNVSFALYRDFPDEFRDRGHEKF